MSSDGVAQLRRLQLERRSSSSTQRPWMAAVGTDEGDYPPEIGVVSMEERSQSTWVVWWRGTMVGEE